MEEKEKLAEFITLMERLRALQQNGVLDAMIDAILKLATEGDKKNVR
jgi:peptidoglycan hydrolase CwlO-like protein